MPSDVIPRLRRVTSCGYRWSIGNWRLPVAASAARTPACWSGSPLAGDVLPRLTPRLKVRLLAVFDVSVLWSKSGRQATVRAEITEATLQVLANTQPRTASTDQPEPMGDLTNTSRAGRTAHRPGK
jgi:hypothetical protein